MKTQTLSPGAWPYGLEVETTPEGLLLKPRRKPREGWVKARRAMRRFVMRMIYGFVEAPACADSMATSAISIPAFAS